MSEVVAEMEGRFLPRLAEVGREIERDYPKVHARLWSAPVGSLTEYQGHVIGLECWLAETPAGRPDSVGLEIGVRHLTTAPELAEAYVAWAEGRCEIDLLASPVPYSLAAIAALEGKLGDLVGALRGAVGRGEPLS
jgi:hypothetical protein